MVSKKLMKESSKKAEKYEEEAKLMEESGTPQGDISKIYKIAGNRRKRAGEYSKALKDYNLAIEHAYNPHYIKSIKEKMKSIPGYYISRARKKMRGISRIDLGLEKRIAFGILSIVSLVVSLFFISVNLTGYSIEVFDNSQTPLSIGVFSFILGLVFAFFYFKKKKKIKR